MHPRYAAVKSQIQGPEPFEAWTFVHKAEETIDRLDEDVVFATTPEELEDALKIRNPAPDGFAYVAMKDNRQYHYGHSTIDAIVLKYPVPADATPVMIEAYLREGNTLFSATYPAFPAVNWTERFDKRGTKGAKYSVLKDTFVFNREAATVTYDEKLARRLRGTHKLASAVRKKCSIIGMSALASLYNQLFRVIDKHLRLTHFVRFDGMSKYRGECLYKDVVAMLDFASDCRCLGRVRKSSEFTHWLALAAPYLPAMLKSELDNKRALARRMMKECKLCGIKLPRAERTGAQRSKRRTGVGARPDGGSITIAEADASGSDSDGELRPDTVGVDPQDQNGVDQSQDCAQPAA